jgi:hypothetical protein
MNIAVDASGFWSATGVSRATASFPISRFGFITAHRRVFLAEFGEYGRMFSEFFFPSRGLGRRLVPVGPDEVEARGR